MNAIDVADDAPGGVTYRVWEGIATITLNRPPVNAFSLEMYERLATIARTVASDESARVAILTSASNRVFCGGADVKELGALDERGRAAFAAASRTAARSFAAIPIPVIAAITGKCAGVGVTYPTFCDYRIAAEHAQFTLPEINMGFLLGGGRDLMAVGVPSGPLRMMLYSGSTRTADEALAMHLVDEVVPGERVMSTALDRARPIASKAREALVAMKGAINYMSFNERWAGDVGAT